MKILFCNAEADFQQWRDVLCQSMPEIELFDLSEASVPFESIDIALVWKPPPGVLRRLPNLRLIQNLGMGVDALFEDPELPGDVPIARLVDQDLIAQMSEYILWAVLHHHRLMDDYGRLQEERRWQMLPPPVTADRRIGIMGLGTIGADVVARLRIFGFKLLGWSRSAKTMAGVDCYHGEQGLAGFLAQTELLVCLLPLTGATRGLINTRTLQGLPAGAVVINVARGELVVTGDLLAALDSGHLKGAVLDVVDQEPLPADHPLWHHPKVRLTPHIAGLTRAITAVPQVLDNIARLRAGQTLVNLVDRQRQY